MKLKKFRVYNFKSIEDSDWVNCEDITTLVGVNEAGKSNLLLALWKFNPAKDGEIKFADDMPVSRFSEFRIMENKPKFIECEFEILDEELLNELSKKFDETIEDITTVKVSRCYDGKYECYFPNAQCKEVDLSDKGRNILIESISKIQGLEEKGKRELGLKAELISLFKAKDHISKISDLNNLIELIERAKLKTLASSEIKLALENIILKLGDLIEIAQKETINQDKTNLENIVKFLPKFVYYSNYGNLDSEIYLPHVVNNLRRNDISDKVTSAKTRTLRVLFDYVGLDLIEILDMSPDKVYYDYYNNVIPQSENNRKIYAEKSKERDLLLQSASSKLTKDFKDWWKQGDYKFRLSVDGTQFRILVSDDRRPEEIVLENRSTGLQWFLSFYLVFLVESKEAHSGAIILLDEAGMSLHPLAQKDLTKFFDKLSQTNQIVHTTHSPFLVNPESIERAKVVYVDNSGCTVVSDDLKSATKNDSAIKSNYAIYAALGLSVSDILLEGSSAVIVEGVSDQYYLYAIKQALLSKGLIKPEREIVFFPSGGVRGVNSLVSILSHNGVLPVVIIDSDKSGNDFKKKLLASNGLYVGNENKIISIDEFTKVSDAEIEDLFDNVLFKVPYRNCIYKNLLKLDIDKEFDDVFLGGASFNQQLESSVDVSVLPKGYKVELSKEMKKFISQNLSEISEEQINIWKKLFDRILEE